MTGLQRASTTFTALDSAQFATKIGNLGIGDGDTVVVYYQGVRMCATRLWWNLRLERFDAVAVLDGGFTAWRAAGQPVATGTEMLPPATFTAHRRPELLASKDEILAALDRTDVQLVNSLNPSAALGALPALRPRSPRCAHHGGREARREARPAFPDAALEPLPEPPPPRRRRWPARVTPWPSSPSSSPSSAGVIGGSGVRRPRRLTAGSLGE